ncbi:hypothetical protein BD410DRAFT_714859 [Rickenella mellea]|uniref:Nucleoporin n=1 Tax=Rickenella mellea TaxID=50990 RepID=A0A4Y7QIP5_9AGAM|nr:hypothetical protein BD410DRAFT_714859 [Rickenella mellea]
MVRISTLRATLINALGRLEGDQELFDELTVQKASLLKVFDFGPRSQQELKELESGKIQVNGRPLAVNSDFARQVAFLSQQLNCSERFCAGLLHTVLSENPNIDQVQAVEKSVVEFHHTRRDLADCLRFIFEAASVAQQGHASRLHVQLNEFARRHLITAEGDKSLGNKVFAEIANLGDAITAAKAAVTNAISQTNIPGPQNANANLGHAVLTARLESLMYERRTLSFALFFIARSGYLTSPEVRQMIEWLDQKASNGTTYYILAAVFATFDLCHSSPGSSSASLREALVKDPATLTFFKKKLAPATEWKDSSLKATIQLKWALFLTEARLRDHSLEHRDGFKNEDLEMQILTAIQGDAFSYLTRAVVQLGVRPSATSQLLVNATSASRVDPSEPRTLVSDDFKIHLLHEFELLIRSLLTHAPAELRKIKHKQEDQFRPRSDRHPRSSFKPTETAADKSSHPPRSDIATLFQLIGILYTSLPPETAIQFWGGVPSTETPAYYELVEADKGKLPSFLRWAVEVREQDLIIAVFDMLSGLANGQSCSEFAYNFMATGTLDVVHGAVGRYEMAAAFTWGSIFGELESWAALGANHRGAHAAPTHQLPIAPKDVLLGLSFLKLLSSVVTHSVQARIAIFTHPQYRAISSLVSLIPLGVPLELKGALFETLSAFCQPGAGVQGVEIAKSVWAQMERLEVINVRGGGIASKGVEVELEEIESVYKVYPATIPFLELLSTLIHTPKRVPLKNRIMEPVPINTIPDNLGQPYRHPGIGPFVSFVVENVLGNIQRREFLDQADSWRMTDRSFCFLERCLASYDVESLSSLSEAYAAKGPEVLIPFLQHPGFDVLTRILSDTPLRATILSYLIEGSEELHRQQAKDAYFPQVLIRTLRIVDRVLAVQDIFLDQLLPALSEFDSASILGKSISQSFFSRIDQSLSFDHRSVPAIASYVNYPAYPELVYLAIKVLSSLGQSTSFSNIAALIERSSESEVILDGFVRLLGAESSEDVVSAEEWVELWAGAGAPDTAESGSFTEAIRLGILDLLLRGTKNKTSSLAFLLLFGSGSTEQIQDPRALGARVFCLHVVLQLVNIGVPTLSGRPNSAQIAPFFASQPVLAERLYRLLYQLCVHPRTSRAMILYLRTHEDFFARHLSVLSFHAPNDASEPGIEVVYGDGSRTTTTCMTLKAFLQLRSWILELAALELHILTNKGQNQRVKEILDILLANTEHYLDNDGALDSVGFYPFNDVSQSHIRLIELFQSQEFEWFDSVTISPVNLEFYKDLNLQLCLRVDESGCEIVDRSLLFQLLNTSRRSLLSQGHVATAAHSQQLENETKYILESCVVENNRREVQFALSTGYESWKRLLDVILTKCFNHVANDQREGILFDLLHILPPSIRAPSLPEPTAVLLSEAVLLLVTKLREERRQLHLLTSGHAHEASALPTERMLGLLRNILECIVDNHRKELVRGNLYAALANYMHLVSGSANDSATSLPHENGDHSRLVAYRPSDDALSTASTSSMVSSVNTVKRSPASGTSLQVSTIGILKQVMDRLVLTISRDVIDGAEVWKTVAFTLLDSLARLARLDKDSLILTALDRYGFLANFVRGLKDSDLSLQGVLRPDPDDLNPLYVYEAKMSFLIRLAQTRRGAERLLESRVLPILAQVDFLDARPEDDEAFIDNNSFLPSAISRYHQQLVPALQLVEGVLATLGPKHSLASKQALDFLDNHRDTLVILLKNESHQISLTTLEELDIITSLCAIVVPSVHKGDLFAHTAFGGLHKAVLRLGARYLGRRHWTGIIHPSTETEMLQANSRAPGYDATASKFDVRVSEAGNKFRKSILAYLGAASVMTMLRVITESDLNVVLSPVATPRNEEQTSGVLVALPSLNDAIEALNDFCDDLLSALQNIVDISAELEHKEHLRIDSLEDVATGMDADSLRRLDAGQRRIVVVHFLEQEMTQSKSRAESVLSSLEMLLLLIWRHLIYYNEGSAVEGQRYAAPVLQGRQQQQMSRSSTMQFPAMPDTRTFQKDVARALGRVLGKLQDLELNEDVGRAWRANQSYIEVMCRRLRDTVSLSTASDDNSQ